MTAFIQSSPGLIPTFADPSLIPSLSAEHGLSNVMEEDPELVESLNEQAEIEKAANTSSSSIFAAGAFDANRPPYRGSIWSSSSTTVDTFIYGSRRSSLPHSKSLSSASETSTDSVLLSPLAANRAIYRKSLLRHSIVADTQMGGLNNHHHHSRDPNMNDVRSSATSASLVMKRGTLFPNNKSLMGGTMSSQPPPQPAVSMSRTNHHSNNATMDTVDSVVSLEAADEQ